MGKIDPEMAQLVKYIDSETHGQFGMTSIADDDKRRAAVAAFIRRRLDKVEKLEETQPQRRLRKNALRECVKAIRNRERDCYCQKELLPGVANRLCNPCLRCRDALKLWVDMERMINRRYEIQREYFTAVCTAKELVNPDHPPEKVPVLEPANVIQALEIARDMDEEGDDKNKSQKLG